jgi:hypothetical protein
MEVSGQLHTPVTLSLRKQAPVPTGWVGPRDGRDTINKNLLPLPGIEPQPSKPQLAAIPTELSRLQSIEGAKENNQQILLLTYENYKLYEWSEQ